MADEYVIYCDESISSGDYYSNFYGGALISSTSIDAVRRSISNKKVELRFHGEVKWQKITANYKDKYIALIDHFFDLVECGLVKLRVMFTQDIHVPRNLAAEHVEDAFFILYYQFIKHGFGLIHCPTSEMPVNLRIYLDRLPDTKEKADRFKAFLCSLTQNPDFRRARLVITKENVTDVESHEHDILQCLDVVLGSMQFRLNDKHKETLPGSRFRGNRTRAKEEVYKHINRRIRGIYPNFNIGITTGINGDVANRWRHAYRHWRFVPSERLVLDGKSKRAKK